MRRFLLLGCIAALGALPVPARAAQGPWCAVVPIGMGVVSEICSMPSFEACRREAMSWGSSSFCRQNSRYPGYWKQGGEPRRAKHRRKSRHR